MKNQVCCVIPSWNARDEVGKAISSLMEQSLPPHIIVVENGSIDGSAAYIAAEFPDVELIIHTKNRGFAGGVNAGIKKALTDGFTHIALFNNDAVADKNWLKHLAHNLDTNPKTGIVTCKLMHTDKNHLDSTGDMYTNWGLPYPRGRGEVASDDYDAQTAVFAASGGASLYRAELFTDIGLFDEDFFAYYEDVDISFRAQLAGWHIAYEPSAIAYHQIGATSSKIKGFTTYQTMKNQPLVLFKNVPSRYLFSVGWRFTLAHSLFFIRAITRGQGWAALRGDAQGTYLLFKKAGERRRIQKTKKVSDEYIWSIMTHDLPPNAHALRNLRKRWWKLAGKSAWT